MRLGFTVPQFGPDAGPDALLEVARKAEDLPSRISRRRRVGFGSAPSSTCRTTTPCSSPEN